MKKIPRISESEWKVMQVVWDQPPRSASQIIEALNHRDATWHPSTVKTLLNRLVKKKALGFKAEARTYLYHPLVRQDECADLASRSFLDQVFGGSLKPMLAHFVERKRLSRAEIQELKDLLENEE